ncbi:MAG: fibronectin type III domain-containing protein [Acidimicrobiales bacterium]|nr:fibronectin type III domain-containing protein [Acidimicrobiales bacterium]
MPTTAHRRMAAALVAAIVAALLVAAPVALDIGPAAATGRGPGEPAPVDLTQISNTPVQGGWGVTGLDPDRTTNYETLVWDFAQIGDRFYVAGSFLNVQRSRNSTPVPQPYLAAFDLITGEWVPEFAPQLDGSVYALDVSPRGRLLIGGEFTNVAGLPNTSGVSSLDPITGAPDPYWTGSVERPWSTEVAVVRSLEVVGNDLYVGGNFSHVRGNSDTNRGRVYKLARINASWGIPDLTWRPEVTGSGIWGFGVDPARNRIHLTGWFSAVNGQPGTGNFATVDLTSGALVGGLRPLAYNDTRRPEMFDVEVAADKVWVGGSQHFVQVLDANDHRRIGYHTTGFRCNGFNGNSCGYIGGGDFQVVEEIGQYVFAGCHCTWEERYGILSHYSSFSNRRYRTLLLEAYDKQSGELVSSFVPDLAGSEEGVWAVHSDSLGCLLVGGQFDVAGLKTGNSFWVGNFARFCPPGALVPDTQSPTIPAGVAAVETSTGVVALSWQASADDRGMKGYAIYRDGGYVGWSDTPAFTESGVALGFHEYAVRAFDTSDNQSEPSAPVGIHVGGLDTTPPTVPAGLGTTIAGSDVTLGWTPSSDDVGVTGYLVYRDGGYLGWTQAPGYIDAGVAHGAHRYEVRAQDAAGNLSDKTPAVEALVGGPDTTAPTVPDGVVATAAGVTVSLTWTPATDDRAVTGYLVYRDGAYVGWSATTSFVDPGVTAGTHSYQLRAHDAAGNRSEKSVAVLATVV